MLSNISNLQTQFNLGLLQQALQVNQNAATMLIQGQQGVQNAIAQANGGNLSPNKGQLINLLG